MSGFRTGDAVTRKSYGGDVLFRVSAIEEKSEGKKYILKGLLYRIEADASEDDLEWQQPRFVRQQIQSSLGYSPNGVYRPYGRYRPYRSNGRFRADGSSPSDESSPPDGSSRSFVSNNSYGTFRGFGGVRGFGEFLSYLAKHRGTPGKILHLDSSGDFLDMSYDFYRGSNLIFSGKEIPESEQPDYVVRLLEKTRADILVVTGHDGIKKGSAKLNSLDNYRNSSYFIKSVQNARSYQRDMDKLCIFAGACQSYYEGIMDAGANFASSPGRVLIHALDPAKVADSVAMTDSRHFVTAEKIAEDTQSGLKGIGGINTRGHLIN